MSTSETLVTVAVTPIAPTKKQLQAKARREAVVAAQLEIEKAALAAKEAEVEALKAQIDAEMVVKDSTELSEQEAMALAAAGAAGTSLVATPEKVFDIAIFRAEKEASMQADDSEEVEAAISSNVATDPVALRALPPKAPAQIESSETGGTEMVVTAHVVLAVEDAGEPVEWVQVRVLAQPGWLGAESILEWVPGLENAEDYIVAATMLTLSGVTKVMAQSAITFGAFYWGRGVEGAMYRRERMMATLHGTKLPVEPVYVSAPKPAKPVKEVKVKAVKPTKIAKTMSLAQAEVLVAEAQVRLAEARLAAMRAV